MIAVILSLVVILALVLVLHKAIISPVVVTPPVPPNPPTPPTPPIPPAPPSPPNPPTGSIAPLPFGVHLTVVVQSTNISADDVTAYIVAQQIQIDQDFSPSWGGSAKIDQVSGGWPIYLTDVSDVQGALGYHDVDASEIPYAKVFITTSQQAGVSWQSVASHEVLETLADSNVNTTDVGIDGCDWYQEVGDPVEDLSYIKNGVELSNFITPSWFINGGKAPFDFMNALSAPFTLTSGGYAMKICNGQTITVGGARTISVDKGYYKDLM